MDIIKYKNVSLSRLWDWPPSGCARMVAWTRSFMQGRGEKEGVQSVSHLTYSVNTKERGRKGHILLSSRALTSVNRAVNQAQVGANGIVKYIKLYSKTCIIGWVHAEICDCGKTAGRFRTRSEAVFQEDRHTDDQDNTVCPGQIFADMRRSRKRALEGPSHISNQRQYVWT